MGIPIRLIPFSIHRPAWSIWLRWLFVLVLLWNPVWSDPVPYPMQWNTTHVFGPDGPWQAIPIRVGWPEQLVNLYPGSSWASTLLGISVCGKRPSCVARQAGLYDLNKSNNASTQGTANHAIGGDAESFTGPLNPDWRPKDPLQLQGNGTLMTDRIRFEIPNVAAEISNFSMVVAHTANITLPDRSMMPLGVGFLSLGGRDIMQSFRSDNAAGPHYVANLLPGWLAINGHTPSNSWGLHIGSAVPAANMSGSLVFGGYDETRVIGDVSTYDVPNAAGDALVNLLDIGIGVEHGGSPFPFSSIDGLLKAGEWASGRGNGDGGGGSDRLRVRPNPTVPYLYLPATTCQEIAKHLPVTYAPSIDLYLWKTDDPTFTRIVTSPSFLRFTFQAASGNLTIKVPFRLLNLTITPPLVPSPQPYFPCRAYVPPVSTGAKADGVLEEREYHLGRAFMQAAFMGMNWSRNKWWLAQASGPKMTVAPLRSIDNDTVSISSFQKGNWSASWDGFWTALPQVINPAAATSTGVSLVPTGASTASSNSPTISASPSSASKMTPGVKAGVGVVVSLAGLAVFLGAILYYLRRRKQQRVYGTPPEQSYDEHCTANHQYPPAMAKWTPGEMSAGEAACEIGPSRFESVDLGTRQSEPVELRS
ncbi:MAG: hypothetical protein M1823_001881 [Watsoniomyces obsoletus]|nr:MAG: hypothetical protein M1823_001881 [Watsoniomyces obsoletus]